jgi:hypothetical protein
MQIQDIISFKPGLVLLLTLLNFSVNGKNSEKGIVVDFPKGRGEPVMLKQWPVYAYTFKPQFSFSTISSLLSRKITFIKKGLYPKKQPTAFNASPAAFRLQ